MAVYKVSFDKKYYFYCFLYHLNFAILDFNRISLVIKYRINTELSIRKILSLISNEKWNDCALFHSVVIESCVAALFCLCNVLQKCVNKKSNQWIFGMILLVKGDEFAVW